MTKELERYFKTCFFSSWPPRMVSEKKRTENRLYMRKYRKNLKKNADDLIKAIQAGTSETSSSEERRELEKKLAEVLKKIRAVNNAERRQKRDEQGRERNEDATSMEVQEILGEESEPEAEARRQVNRNEKKNVWMIGIAD